MYLSLSFYTEIIYLIICVFDFLYIHYGYSSYLPVIPDRSPE